MRKVAIFTLLTGLITLVPQKALAHCPLCTAGAGAIAVAATALGVRVEVIGLLIGAFAAALGFYIANRIKKQYFPGQKWVVMLAIFLLTIIPLVPFMAIEPYALVIYWFGEMGSLFNSVYLVDRFIVGSVFGGLLMTLSPWISAYLTRARGGKRFPYQSLLVTFTLLIVTSLVIQVV